MVIGHTPLLLQNCGISYHWTLGYHRQLLYLKLSRLRHICLRILLISFNYGIVKRHGQLVKYGAV